MLNEKLDRILSVGETGLLEPRDRHGRRLGRSILMLRHPAAAPFHHSLVGTRHTCGFAVELFLKRKRNRGIRINDRRNNF